MFIKVALVSIAFIFSSAHVAQAAWDTFGFMEAADKGNLAAVKAYLDQGLNPNMTLRRGGTALMIASAKGRVKVAQLLINRGAHINIKSREGHTALSLAAAYGKDVIALLLLERGADIDAKTFKGKTAMVIASRRGHLNVVSAIMKWRIAKKNTKAVVARKF